MSLKTQTLLKQITKFEENLAYFGYFVVIKYFANGT